MTNKKIIDQWQKVIESDEVEIKSKRKQLDTLKTLSKEEIKYLESAADVMWEAMNRLIKKDGYSDLTLHLEGSVYELKDIISKHKNLEVK